MSAKLGLARPGQNAAPSPTVGNAVAHNVLTLKSRLLSSHIALPEDYIISYVCFTAAQACDTHQTIDRARKQIFESNSNRALEDSILSYTHLDKDSSFLWLFSIVACNKSEDERRVLSGRLNDISLPGLTRSNIETFRYCDIYPCSSSCSFQRHPCPNCLLTTQLSPKPVLSQTSTEKSQEIYTLPPETHPIITARFTPREPLRRPIAFFTNAVKERLLYDICREGTCTGKPVLRLKDGLVWSSSDEGANWIDGWKQHGSSQPLPFCHLEVTLIPLGLLISPSLMSTEFVPFIPAFTPLPGTPINLLPFSTPAYYLNLYAGPTSALVKQFDESLKGLVPEDLLRSNHDFVIAWISVQNKQGDEKGIMVIWPACLCVTLLAKAENDEEKGDRPTRPSSFSYKRRLLPFLPEMPLPLQPSPIPAHAAVPSQRTASPHVAVSPSALTTGDSGLFSSKETSPQVDLQSTVINVPEIPSSRKFKHVSSMHAPRAFRVFAFRQQQHRNFRDVAIGAGRYVDAIAKERERERDRMRKEREAVASGQGMKGSPLQQTIDTPGVSADTTFQQLPTPGNLLMSSTSTPSAAAFAAQLVGSPTYASPLATQIAQPTYPSPPDEVAVPRLRSISQPMSADISKAGSAFQQQVLPKIEPFEAFGGNIDNFMNDIGLGYGMNAPKSASYEAAISPVQNQVSYDTFGAFTDDDFNFFDDPIGTSAISFPDSKSAAVPLGFEQMQPLVNEDLLKAALDIAPTFTTDFLNSLPATIDLPITPGISAQWTTPKASVGDETKGVAPFLEEIQPVPELQNSPSDQSSMSPTEPLTPEVVGVIPPESDNLFQAVHFHDNLQASNAKYVSGKFSFPVTGKQSDDDIFPGMSYRRGLYSLATNPRISIIKKLIGMKRRQASQGQRGSADVLPCRSNVYDDASSVGDEEVSDQDSEDSDGESIPGSRPSTPLPSYVPLGPTLVATQFSHSLLFPLAVSLRPSGPSFADIQSPLPNPVPTPVSPSAMGGHGKEGAVSLMSFVLAMCLELLENGSWADEWRIASNRPVRGSSVNHEDAFDGNHLFSNGWIFKPLSIGGISELANTHNDQGDISLVPLLQPLISIGKSHSIVNMSPPALRFWAKLGLAPRSGPKNVTTFILFEGDNMLDKAETWLQRVSDVYKAKGYGSHVPGKAPSCKKNGLIHINFATFRRAFTGIVDSLDAQSHLPILFYLIIPTTNLSTRAHILQQVFAALKSVSADSHRSIYYHFIPTSLLDEDDVMTNLKTELAADDVYNKIKRTVSRFMSRPIFVQSQEAHRSFKAPSFVLARGTPITKALFSDELSASADIVERHTFLHVGYKLSDCRTWLVAAILDQRGENHDLKVWRSDASYTDEECVNLVWSFAMEAAGQAKVEWRLAIAKLGSFNRRHLEAWNVPLSILLSTKRTIPIQVSILSVEDSSWSVIEQSSTSRLDPELSLLNDAYLKKDMLSSSSTSFTLSQLLRLPLSSCRKLELGEDQDHVVEDDSTKEQGAGRLMPMQTAVLICSSTQQLPMTRAVYIHMLANIKSPGSTLNCTEMDTHREICRSYHDLAVLTKLRWRIPSNTNLPFHIASLQVADEVLDQINSISD